MHLAVRILSAILLAGALLIPRLQWRRAAFAGFVALGLGSFAIRAGWPTRPLSPSSCELLVDRALALYSFRNTPHIFLFALFFLLARAQFPRPGAGRAGGWLASAGAFAITLTVGALVELAEGISGAGHCRLRDLLSDAAGALLGVACAAALVAGWTRWRGGRGNAWASS